jgi:hypothetical protein
VWPARLDVEMARFLEVIGEPEQEEEPDRIGQEFGRDE